jgi:hypothetical protein
VTNTVLTSSFHYGVRGAAPVMLGEDPPPTPIDGPGPENAWMTRHREARKAIMSDDITVTIGGTLKDDLAAFRSAWEQAKRGEPVQSERVLAFESRECLASAVGIKLQRRSEL